MKRWVKSARCRPPLGLSEIRTFIRLVDKGSPAKGFTKLLGLTLDDVRFHTTLTGFYRKYIEVHDKIVEVRQLDISQEEKKNKIAQLRQELKDAKN